MKTIKIGTVNDVTVYAMLSDESLVPLEKTDFEFFAPDYEILCDSGAYPGVTNFKQFICNEAYHEFLCEN